MKKRTFLIVVLVMVFQVFGFNAKASDPSDKRILIAYFSRSGNTKAVANHIKSIVGGDLFEIVVEKPYPDDYHKCTEQASEEKKRNARPALKSKVDNMGAYDVVFVGFPNWWGTMPMPVMTFLEQYNLKGKLVIPFCTHGGGGEQSCFKDFVKATEGAMRKDGFLINGGQAESAHDRVEQWLKNINLLK